MAGEEGLDYRPLAESVARILAAWWRRTHEEPSGVQAATPAPLGSRVGPSARTPGPQSSYRDEVPA
jgi:hypothetical protein